ncbi:MAG TPA: hypothetical protein VEQ85_07990 [Lacipirellulaceae bacterium]|nr:hypothetical protein [Lacipirellulaceae bacterium]
MWIGVALLIVGAVAAYFIARNWRDWTADLGVQVVEQTLEASDLPAPEKAEIGAQVDRVATAFREGKLSARQIEALVQRLAASPLATSLVVAAVESKYLQKSGLPEEEKSAGRTTLRRFARGVIDSSIPEAQRDAALAHLADRDADGGWTLRERVSDDELRAFFAAAEAEADAAQIPDEPEVVDPSEELRRVIDDALGEGAPPAPAP